MPWNPSFDAPAHDPRLDPYRGRAGVLSLEGADVGHVLVETDVAQLKAGGMLWWSRWEPPQECAIVSLHLDGDVLDGLTHVQDDLTDRIAQWDRGVDERGPTYQVRWLEDAESERVHREVFGHHH